MLDRSTAPGSEFGDRTTVLREDEREAVRQLLMQMSADQIMAGDTKRQQLLTSLGANRELLRRSYDDPTLRGDLLYALHALAGSRSINEHDDLGSQLCASALAFEEELAPDMEECAGRNELDWFHASRCFVDLARSEDESQQKLGTTTLARNQRYIESGLQCAGEWHDSYDALGAMLARGEGVVVDQAETLITKALTQSNDATRVGKLYALFFDRAASNYVHDRGRELVTIELTRHGLPAESVLRAWRQSGGNMAAVVEESIARLCALDAAHEGAAKALYEEFNIAEFGRYPIELLIRQYEERDGKERTYGVLIYPRVDDPVGPLQREWPALSSLDEQVRDELPLRVIEYASGPDLLRQIKRLEERYGSCCVFGYLAGHGRREGVNTGGPDRRRYFIQRDDIEPLPWRPWNGAARVKRNEVITALRSVFVSEPTVVLGACATGKDGGFGQSLSRTTGGTVLAPEANNMGVKDFHAVRERDSGWRFDVDYKHSYDYQSCGTVRYVNGKKVTVPA